MTISSQNRQAGPYLGNDVATAFTFAFKVFAASDLQVVRTNAAGVESTLTLTTDYTVTLNSNQDSNPGGTVTLVAGALASNTKLTITSNIQPLQATDLTNQGGFYPKVITNALDKLTILIQQIVNRIGRQITAPISDANPVMTLPAAAARSGKLLGFDANGDVLLQFFSAGTAPVVSTIAALRIISKVSSQVVFVTGYYAAFDGGGGVYCYDPTDTTSADNGGTVIVASDGGRWKLAQAGMLSVRQFGAKGDGVTNDFAAIQATLDAANAAGHGAVLFPQSTGNYKCNSGLTLYPNTVAIQGNGSVVDFSGMTTGYAVAFSQSSNDANYRQALNKSHPISDLGFVGPGGTVVVTAVKGIDQNPITGQYWLSGITFRNCHFTNFYRDVEFGAGSFLWNFYNCNFAITGGTGYDCSILVQSATNSGENHEFISCVFANAGKGIRSLNGNATLYFRGCSADYLPNIFDVQAGTLDWDGYIENNADSNYWGKVSGTNSLLRIAGQVAITGNKSAYECFYSDSTATNGGLILDCDVQFSGGVTYTPPSRNIAAGTGRVRHSLRAHSNATVHPPIGAGANALAYGGFESANYTAEWTLSGGATRSNAQAHSGTYSLSLPGSAGVTPIASKTIPCQPGQFFTGGLWYLVPNITGTSGTFYVQVDYLDAGGNSLSSGAIIAQTTNVSSWTFLQTSLNTPAPAGTVNAKIFVDIFGIASGTPTAYIDDVVLSVG